MRLLLAVLPLALATVAPGEARAQSAADSAAVRAAALDYIDGWYGGDSVRMRRAVHPDLAKRIMVREAGGTRRLSHLSADQLVGDTGRGGGRTTPAVERRNDVRILDMFGETASVRVDARDWIDYLHLARGDQGWVIVNALWERRPR